MFEGNCSLVPRPLSTPVARFCILMSSLGDVTEIKSVHRGLGTSLGKLSQYLTLGQFARTFLTNP